MGPGTKAEFKQTGLEVLERLLALQSERTDLRVQVADQQDVVPSRGSEP